MLNKSTDENKLSFENNDKQAFDRRPFNSARTNSEGPSMIVTKHHRRVSSRYSEQQDDEVVGGYGDEEEVEDEELLISVEVPLPLNGYDDIDDTVHIEESMCMQVEDEADCSAEQLFMFQ